MPPRSPLAPATTPELPPVAGARLGAVAAGLRYRKRTDLMLAEFAPGTTVAGVFTRSTTASAPVLWNRSILAAGTARALVANSGTANVFTGAAGSEAVRRTVDQAAAVVGCAREQVYICSTGVIGEPLDAAKVTAAIGPLRETATPGGWLAAAEAIMTTDTYAKAATRTARIGDRCVTLNGIAKGSGMIAPNMATMLAFIATDAALDAPVLQTLLARGCRRSFNSITVDGDTSTSDTVLLFATGAADCGRSLAANAAALRDFRAALEDLMLDLAHQIVRDGEGASKFVAVEVTGARSETAARRIGLAIANSPLVKTAIAGEDPNWGRIVMAVGKSEQEIAPERLAISIGGIPITANGHARDDYREPPVAAHMKGSEISIAVDVGVGKGRATVWTCDLSHGYIDINADYRS